MNTFKHILVVGTTPAKISFLKQLVPVAGKNWMMVSNNAKLLSTPDLSIIVMDDTLQRDQWLQFLRQKNIHTRSLGVIMSKDSSVNRTQKDLLLYNEIDSLGFGYDELSESFSPLDVDRVKARIEAASSVHRSQLLIE